MVEQDTPNKTSAAMTEAGHPLSYEIARGASRRRAANWLLSDMHGRIITVLKIALPAATVILIGVLISWPRFYSTEPGFMLSFSDIANYDDTVRMVSPRYAGTDLRNQPFVITADTAVQTEAGADEVSLEGLEADITLADGAWLSLEAQTGIYRPGDESLDASGSVSVYSDLGYEFHSESAFIDFAGGKVEGRDPVRGQGPVGKFEANSFSADLVERVVRLEGDVKATIYPERSQ